MQLKYQPQPQRPPSTRPLLLVTFLLLISCGSIRPRPPQLLYSAPPQSVQGKRFLQSVRVERRDSHRELLCSAEFTSNKSSLACITPLGLTLFSAEMAADGISVDRAPHLPHWVDVAGIFSSIQLVHWPENAIKRTLRPSWSIFSSECGRVLIHKGIPAVSINESCAGPNTVTMSHHLQEATIEIKQLSRERIE